MVVPLTSNVVGPQLQYTMLDAASQMEYILISFSALRVDVEGILIENCKCYICIQIWIIINQLLTKVRI